MGALELSAVIGTWLGVVVGVVGFGLALWQIRKTLTAAESARSAIEATQSEIASNLFRAALHELQDAERRLNEAMRSGESTLAMTALREWRLVARRVGGLAEASRDPTVASFRESVGATAGLAATAEDLLAVGQDLMEATTEFRRSAAVDAHRAGELAARLSVYTGGQPHHD